MAKMTKKHVAA